MRTNKEFEGKVAFFSFIALIILLLFTSLISCKVKKEIIETHSTDTIYKNSIIRIDKPQLNTIKIDNICDSLGNFRPFKITYGTKSNNTTLIGKDNIIYLEQNIDSIVNSKVEEYKSSLKTEKKETPVPYIPNWIKKLLGTSLFLNFIAGIWILRKPIFILIKKLINPLL